MKKGEIYEGIVENMDFPNKGNIYIEGERVIVKNALPGQKVRFLVNKRRKGKCEGRLLSVEESSPLERTEHPCPHFGICGGCLYQTIPYEEQLKIKERQVRDILTPVLGEPGEGSWTFEGIMGSPMSERYRNKMEFSFGD